MQSPRWGKFRVGLELWAGLSLAERTQGETSQRGHSCLPLSYPALGPSSVRVWCGWPAVQGPDSEKTRGTRRPVNRQIVHAQPTTPATNQGCFVRIYKGQRSQEVETTSRGKWLPKGNSRRGPKRPPAMSRGVLQKLGAAFPGPNGADVWHATECTEPREQTFRNLSGVSSSPCSGWEVGRRELRGPPPGCEPERQKEKRRGREIRRCHCAPAALPVYCSLRSQGCGSHPLRPHPHCPHLPASRIAAPALGPRSWWPPRWGSPGQCAPSLCFLMRCWYSEMQYLFQSMTIG